MNIQEMIENRTFDEINLQDSASICKRISQHDIESFALLSGDYNPAHLDSDYAENTMFKGVIAHGMWGGTLISAVLGTQLPGPGTIYLEQTLRFLKPVFPDDEVTATVTVIEKHATKPIIKCQCEVTNQKGKTVISGVATVMAPTEKVSREKTHFSEVATQHTRGAVVPQGHVGSINRTLKNSETMTKH